MNSKRSRNILLFRFFCLIVLGILLVRGCIVPQLQFLKETDLGGKEMDIKNERYHKKYLSFLKPGVVKKMKVLNNFGTQSKSNYFEIYYDHRFVFFHIIEPTKKFSFDSLLKLEKRSLAPSPGVVYAGSEDGLVRFFYSLQSFKFVENLIITYDASLINCIKQSDSLMNINYTASSSSFRYEQDGINDMAFKSVNDGGPVHFNVVVLNKGNYVLVAVAVPGASAREVNESFIINMLNL